MGLTHFVSGWSTDNKNKNVQHIHILSAVSMVNTFKEAELPPHISSPSSPTEHPNSLKFPLQKVNDIPFV